MPAPLDVERLLATLDQHGVEYVVIGGMAARLHGSPLLTEDLDITPSTDRANLGRLAAALRALDARLRVPGLDKPVALEFDEHSFDAFTSMTLTTSAGLLDLCLRRDGTKGYPDLAAGAQPFEVFGLRISVASLADIIRSKQAAGRNKDLQALPTLRALQERLSR